MAFSITNFITNMPVDGARPNLFEIVFPALNGSAKFSFRAKATSIPGSSIGVAPVFYFGRQIKFAGDRSFDPWTVSILSDEDDYSIGPRSALETWMASLKTHQSNQRVSNFVQPDIYMKDAEIIHYGKAGGVIATYKMIQAFPIDISPVTLDWGNNDTIEEFSATFAYQYWTNDVVNN
jgi:hypothetical protein